MTELRTNILNTFGRQFASRGAAVVGGSWITMVSMDRSEDWLLYGTLFNRRHNSIIKRVSDLTGDHGDLAITLNEKHQEWTQLQKDIKDTFKEDLATGVNMYYEKKMGVEMEFKLFGKHYHTDMPWVIYTNYLTLLGVFGLGTIFGGKTAKEGLDKGMGGGGGGGGPAHQPA